MAEHERVFAGVGERAHGVRGWAQLERGGRVGGCDGEDGGGGVLGVVVVVAIAKAWD